MSNKTLQILLLEDNVDDAFLLELYVKRANIKYEITEVTVKEEYIEALEKKEYDLILCDHGLPSFNSMEALKMARAKHPKIPFILISAKLSTEAANEILKEGADAYLPKDNYKDLIEVIQGVLKAKGE